MRRRVSCKDKGTAFTFYDIHASRGNIQCTPRTRGNLMLVTYIEISSKMLDVIDCIEYSDSQTIDIYFSQ